MGTVSNGIANVGSGCGWVQEISGELRAEVLSQIGVNHAVSPAAILVDSRVSSGNVGMPPLLLPRRRQVEELHAPLIFAGRGGLRTSTEKWVVGNRGKVEGKIETDRFDAGVVVKANLRNLGAGAVREDQNHVAFQAAPEAVGSLAEFLPEFGWSDAFEKSDGLLRSAEATIEQGVRRRSQRGAGDGVGPVGVVLAMLELNDKALGGNLLRRRVIRQCR